MSPRQIRYWINHAGNYFLVAVTGSKLAGAALGITRRNSKFIRLYSLAVLPTHRGRGIASRLLKDLETVALSSGKLGIRLEVRADHVAAIELYGSMGYQKFGVRPDYYEGHADALRMQKIFADDCHCQAFPNIDTDQQGRQTQVLACTKHPARETA